MKSLEDLVMPFKVAMAYKEDGGEQDTLYSWFGDPDSFINQENGIQWIWVAITESASHYDSAVERSECWPNDGKPLCAAPIIATEIPVADTRAMPESPWKKINGPEYWPEEGRQVLILHPRFSSSEGRLGLTSGFWKHEDKFSRIWYVFDYQHGKRHMGGLDIDSPTHWMPLPAPPSTKGGPQ